MRIVAIVQARLGSTRLHRKVLSNIAGKPMLAHVLERARAINGLSGVVLAVPRTDLEISQYLCAPVVELGSSADVLDRVVRAAQRIEAEAVVRITGDCPLLAPEFSYRVILGFLETSVPFASNVGEKTDGLDTEIVSMEALSAAWWEAREPHEIEHVTAFLRNRPERFPEHFVASPDWWPGPKLSVDTQEDLDRVRAIYANLEPGKFALEDTLAAWEKAGRP